MTFGFVIVRHVNSEESNKYWQESYRCIRRYYDNPILIIDDSSDTNYLTHDHGMVNCTIINSMYPKRAELLGYYYFHLTHFADTAVILHDGVFIQKYIDFESYGPIRSIWSFGHAYDDDERTIPLIQHMNHSSEIIETYYDKSRWVGCFGVMSVITWDMLHTIDRRYNFFGAMLPVIQDRFSRSMLERIFPCLCYLADSKSSQPPHIISDIFAHGWGLTFEQYLTHKQPTKDIIKVWAGR